MCIALWLRVIFIHDVNRGNFTWAKTYEDSLEAPRNFKKEFSSGFSVRVSVSMVKRIVLRSDAESLCCRHRRQLHIPDA